MKKAKDYLEGAFKKNLTSPIYEIKDSKTVILGLIKQAQKDAVKNSIAMLAQSLYSHNELMNKNGKKMQEMCFQKGYNWNDLNYSKKRGSIIIKKENGWESTETPVTFDYNYFKPFIEMTNENK